MPIASWLLPVLWRELDWGAALERFRTQLASSETGPQLQRAAAELGRAFEYVVPDRRRAIAVYELAGAAGVGRARDIALELGWWSAHARLVLVTRAADPDPRLVLDETEAWWDAGHGDLGALAFASVRSSDDSPRAVALAALMGGSDLEQQATVTLARATTAIGADAADAYVMTARLARAAGRPDLVVPWLEAALAAVPGHRAAASFLLATALHSGDPEQIQRYLRIRLEGLDGTAWLDAMRSSALALIGHDHRGLGLRLLRHALERAYESQHTNIPGHLAMWTVLAANASADGNRRELLPLVLTGLQSSQHDVDRVWLGALATEISLRDAGHPVVAGAYAEIVAEFAPDHPIVRELIGIVAATGDADSVAAPEAHDAMVSTEAVRAAAALEDAFDVDMDLDGVYAGAAGEATLETSATATPAPVRPSSPSASKATSSIAPSSIAKNVEPTQPVPSATPVVRPASNVGLKPSIAPASIAKTPAVVSVIKPAEPVGPASIAKPAGPTTPASIASVAKPAGSTTPAKIASVAKPAGPNPPASIASIAKPVGPTTPASIAKPAGSTTPAAVAKPAGPTTPASIVKPAGATTLGSLGSIAKPVGSTTPASIASIAKPAGSTAPASIASIAKPGGPATPAKPASPAGPITSPVVPNSVGNSSSPRPDPSQFLAALRTPDRPVVPPAAPEPADATPRARRIPIPIDVRIILDGKRIDAHSRDISTTGLFVLTNAALAVSAELKIELLLPGAEPFTEDEYTARARVARSGEGGYGIELLDPDAALVAALAALR